LLGDVRVASSARLCLFNAPILNAISIKFADRVLVLIRHYEFVGKKIYLTVATANIDYFVVVQLYPYNKHLLFLLVNCTASWPKYRMG